MRERLNLLLFAIRGRSTVEEVVAIDFSAPIMREQDLMQKVQRGCIFKGDLMKYKTYDLCGGFSGTTSTVPSSEFMKYKAGVQ